MLEWGSGAPAGLGRNIVAAASDIIKLPWFQEGLAPLGDELKLDPPALEARAEKALHEMWSSHQPMASAGWARFGRLVTGRYELRSDREGIERALELNRNHALIALFSHRSYLDIWLLREVLSGSDFAPFHGLAGANLNFWPVGAIFRRTGALFIRRETKGDPVYRFVLRAYLRYLLDSGQNLGWSIEGGRTRTGKLRPPRYGALRYVVDALRQSDGPEAYIVPVSVVYEQLGEVATMAGEALGEGKKPEDIRWLTKFALMQLNQGGGVRIDFGEPLAVREAIARYDQDERSSGKSVERIAVDVCHRINRTTPVTATGLVTVALLAAGRALTLPEVEDTLKPIIDYLDGHTVASRVLDREYVESREWVLATLDELIRTGVVERFDEGHEPVFQVAPHQHLVAAFYRNTLIHFLVHRAIAELAMVMVRSHKGDLRREIWGHSLRIRDLLKFEFFFPERREFEAELMAEIDRVDPDWEGRKVALPVITPERVQLWFERSKPHLAHLVLRPFFDAYLLVANELAQAPTDEPLDRKALLQRCVGVGQQWVLQKRLHSEESVTLELFKNALLLADHMGLTSDTGSDLAERRRALSEELSTIVQALDELARSRQKVFA